MRFGPFIATLILVSHVALAKEKAPLHILFIGNSYTSANSLPSVMQEMAVSAGFPKPVVGSVTPGGYTLYAHAKNDTTLGAIDTSGKNGKTWDAVIIQEQSEVPAVSEKREDVRAMLFWGSATLYKRVKETNPNATVLFFETWARHSEAWKNSSDIGDRFGRDSAEMQRRLRKWIGKAAHRATGKPSEDAVAYVGDAWQTNYESDHPIRLHQDDGSHPTFAGTYLAGLVLFAKIYGVSPLSISYTGELSQTDAMSLKTALKSAGSGYLWLRTNRINLP